MSNNMSNIKQMQSINQGGTKYIQLQTNKTNINSTNVNVVASPTIAASAIPTQLMSNRPVLFQRAGSGGQQIVVVNGNHLSLTPTSALTNQVSVASNNKNTSVLSNQVIATTSVATSSSNKSLPTSIGVTPVSNVELKAKSIQLSPEDMSNVHKCRSFLTTLIKLAAKDGPQETPRRVKVLVQQLIDDKVTPHEFTTRLQQLLNSNPQPYLVPFLSKSLPLLRLSMCQQNSKLGEVPITIAENAIRVSTNPDNIAKQTVVQKNKILTKPTKTINKLPRNNNVPDIRLPRAPALRPATTSLNSHMSSVSGQTYLHHGQQQPPHPSSVAGASSSVLTATVRQIATKGNQRYAVYPATNAGGSYKDDDDINDVATMAGVNLSEENARIMATTELVGTQTRSCRDETVVNQLILQKKMTYIASKNTGILHIHADAVKYLACAIEYRVKDMVEKLASVVNHRHINFKEDLHHEACSDVKSQIKFLQELDQIEKKRHDEAEREVLMKAIKSRSKNDNPEQLRLKERAKLAHQQEMDKIQQRNADQTALNAIGSRKKRLRIDGSISAIDGLTLPPASRKVTRPRVKRANLRDFIFVMENEKEIRKSKALFRSYIK